MLYDNFNEQSLIYPEEITIKSKCLSNFVRTLKESSINLFGNKIYFRLIGNSYQEGEFFCQAIFLKTRTVKISNGENPRKITVMPFHEAVRSIDKDVDFTYLSKKENRKYGWDFELYKGSIETRLTEKALADLQNVRNNFYYKTNY